MTRKMNERGGCLVLPGRAPTRPVVLLGTLYFLACLLLAGPERAFAGSVTTGPMPTDTVVRPDGQVSYVLNSGNSTLTVVSAATNQPLYSITLGQPANTCMDIDWYAPTQRVLVGCNSGMILSVDPATSTVVIAFAHPGANYSVLCADNFSPGVMGWAINSNTGWLTQFLTNGMWGAITPMPFVTPVELVEKKTTPGVPTAQDGYLVAVGNNAPGTMSVYVYDRVTLATIGPLMWAGGPAVNATGIATSTTADAYVSANTVGGGASFLLRLNLAPPVFFPAPVNLWATNLLVDVSVAGTFVSVLSPIAGGPGAVLFVHDAGNPAAILYMGSLNLSTVFNPGGGLSTWIGASGTVDDLYSVYVNQGMDANSEGLGSVKTLWVDAAPSNVTSNLVPVITPAITGMLAQEAVACGGLCDGQTAGVTGGPVLGGGYVDAFSASARSVQYSTGEEEFMLPVLSVPGVGMDLDLVLTYRSRRDYDYRYGQGWFLNQDARLIQQPSGDFIYYEGTGRQDTYVSLGGGQYSAPSQYDTTLTVNGGIKTVTDRFGTVSTFDANGYRTSLADRYGNVLNFSWSSDRLVGIVDTLNRSYTLTYDPTGRLSSVTDFGGRTWTLRYDYLGQLRSLTTPASSQFSSGRTRWFSYSGNNAQARLRSNLLQVWSFKGERVQTLTYDANDVVMREDLGPGYYTFSYDVLQRITTVVDRSSNTTKWTFDPNSMVTRIERMTKGLRQGEPVSYVTTFTIGSNGYVQTVVYPRSNRVDYTYSGFDVTEIRRKETNTSSQSSTDIVDAYQYGTFSQVTQHIDPRGNVTTYTVNGSGNTTQIQHPTVTSPVSQTIAENFTWDSRGRLLTAADGESRQVQLTYYTSGTQNGYLQSVIRDPAGLALTTTIGYDQYGNVTSVTDPRGAATTMTVDTENYVTEVQAPAPFNYRRRFTHDANRNVTKEEVENIDRKGALDPTTPWIDTQLAYDVVDRLTSRTERLTSTTMATTSYEYDGATSLTRITYPESNQDTFEWDERGLLFKATRGAGTTDASTVQFDYDLNGNLERTTNGRGYTTVSAHDLFDRTSQITNALGHYVQIAYDKSSHRTQVSAYDVAAALMARTTNHFDEVDRLWKTVSDRFGTGISTTYPTTIFTHDRAHLLTQVKDPLNNTTTRTYDAAGRLSTVTDARGDYVTYTYDANGNVTQAAETELPATGSSETFTTQFVYDALNRMTTQKEIDRITPSNVLMTTFEYDSRSNLTFRTDAENHPVRWTYDLAGRLTKYERALTVGTQIDDFLTSIDEVFAYDKDHRLITLTDDNFNSTTYAYDALNRSTRTTYADTRYVSRTFDKDDNVATWTDQNGTTVTNTYDWLDRLTHRAVSRGTGVQGTTAEDFQYDAIDRTLAAVDDDYQVEFSWDSVGNLLEERQGYTASGQEKWKTVTTAWTDAGSVAGITYPSAFVLTHTRDAIYRLTTLHDFGAAANIATFTWQGIGRLATTTNQNGTVTEYLYDGFRRVSEVDHTLPGGQTFHKFEYAYDKAHNRRMEKNTFDATWIATLPAAVQAFLGGRNGKGDVFAYDMAYRLVDARYDVTNPLQEVQVPGSQPFASLVQYTLDGLGNRSQTQTTPPAPPATVTYASDVVNQYTAIGGVNRTHDLNGNVSDDGTHLWVYDYRNLVVEVKSKATGLTIATYRHDAEGRRVEKAINGGGTTRYVLDGRHPVEEYDGADNWQARYVYEDGWDRPRSMDRADIADVDGDANTVEILRFHYHQQALGSVTEITQPTGAVAEWMTYDAYGLPTVRTQTGVVIAQSAVGNPWLFAGREWDGESATFHYRSRTYDAMSGRFLQRDPLEYSDGASLYEYVGSSPASYTDPLGLRRGKTEEARQALAAATAAYYKALARQQQALIRVLSLLSSIAALQIQLIDLNLQLLHLKRIRFCVNVDRQIRELEARIAEIEAALDALLKDLDVARDELNFLSEKLKEAAAAMDAALEAFIAALEEDIADDTGDRNDIQEILDNWWENLMADIVLQLERDLGIDDPSDTFRVSEELARQGADVVKEGAALVGLGVASRILSRLMRGMRAAQAVAGDANRLNHIFGGGGRHGLQGLVNAYGSQARAGAALGRAFHREAMRAGVRSGVFQVTTTVRGVSVTLRGAVVDGVGRLGSAWR